MVKPWETLWHVAEHLLPILRWLPRYNVKDDLAGDIIAGGAEASLAAPEAIAYAAIAGVTSASGLYSAIIAPLAYACFGASPQLVTGMTTIM